VQVFEKAPRVGGRTAEVVLGQYRFDLGPTFLMMKFLLDELFEDAGRRTSDYLDCRALDPMYRLNFSDKTMLARPNPADMRDEIERVFPGEGAGLDRFLFSESVRFKKLYPCLQKWRRDAASPGPVVLTDVPADAALLVEESFGPVVCIAPFQREADAIGMANGSAFALSASVWTGDDRQGERVAYELNCGTCVVNDVIRNIANPQVAFGGNRASGYGRYHGAAGLRTFSRIKAVMMARRLHRVEVHWFPFRAKTFDRLRKLLQMRHGRKIWNGMKRLASPWMLLFVVTCGAFIGRSNAVGVRDEK